LLALALAAGLLALAPAQAGVTVTDAWVRATVEGQSATGAYMSIASDRDLSLVGAACAAAQRAEIHEMAMHGDMMMMMPAEKLAVGPGHPLALDEKKYHLMLEGLKRALRPGEKLAITLRFSDARGAGEDVPVQAVVRPLSAHGDAMEQMRHPGHGD
jgi:hypothetical protein